MKLCHFPLSAFFAVRSLLGLCFVLGLSWRCLAQDTAQPPMVAEFGFDTRFATPASFAAVPRPIWVADVEQRGGLFADEPAGWHVAATAPAGSGRLTISLDRSKIAADLAATLVFAADTNSDLAIQLFDAQGRAVVVDLFGNLVEVGNALSTNTFVIPLAKYPTATRIVLRQVSGPVSVYGVVLFPVAMEGEMITAEVQKLARMLGDPLSPSNPLFQNVRNIAAKAKVEVKADPSKQPTEVRTANASLLPAECLVPMKAKTSNTVCICGPGMMNASTSPTAAAATAKAPVESGPPPVLKEVRKLRKPVAVLVEDSHGGTDIFNEYNFGSAQLGRILTAQGAKVQSTNDIAGKGVTAVLDRSLLDRFQVVIVNGRFSGRGRRFEKSEIEALTGWVQAGGSLLVTCSAPTSGDHLDSYSLSPLIKPFGMEFSGSSVLDGTVTESANAHPAVHGTPAFQVLHGTAVLGSVATEEVARIGEDSVMRARKFGKGRVLAFGGGSALQNQSLNSTIIHHSPEQRMHANTRLAMNVAAWLAGE